MTCHMCAKYSRLVVDNQTHQFLTGHATRMGVYWHCGTIRTWGPHCQRTSSPTWSYIDGESVSMNQEAPTQNAHIIDAVRVSAKHGVDEFTTQLYSWITADVREETQICKQNVKWFNNNSKRSSTEQSGGKGDSLREGLFTSPKTPIVLLCCENQLN